MVEGGHDARIGGPFHHYEGAYPSNIVGGRGLSNQCRGGRGLPIKIVCGWGLTVARQVGLVSRNIVVEGDHDARLCPLADAQRPPPNDQTGPPVADVAYKALHIERKGPLTAGGACVAEHCGGGGPRRAPLPPRRLG